MTLVDTSAWIDFFRDRAPIADEVDRRLNDDQVALCGPVVAELRRGLRSRRERERVLPHLLGCHLLEQPPALWEEAGDLGAKLRGVGVTVKTMDLLIATYALVHDVPILTTDTDFPLMHRAGVPLVLVA
jgi:hypothetical protein